MRRFLEALGAVVLLLILAAWLLYALFGCWSGAFCL